MALTCTEEASDGGISHGKPVHFTDAVSSPFLYIPSKTDKDSSGNSPSKQDYITPFLFDESQFARAGDESYFPAFQVDLNVDQPDLALPRTYSATGSPISTFSMSSADDDDVPEVQSLIKQTRNHHLSDPGKQQQSSTSASTSTNKSTTSQRSDTGSRTSSFSTERRRTSRGPTSRSPSSTRPKRSIQHLRGKSGTYAKGTPSRSDNGTPGRNDRDLLALHRESCLLFSQAGQYKELSGQRDGERTPLSTRHSQSHISNTNINDLRHRIQPTSQQHSASTSPLLRPENTPTSPLQSDGIPSPPTNQSTWNPIHHQPGDNPSSTDTLPPPPALPKTVLDWTSPSTRRREYEKIDRASRGIRGAWRKFAPQWCQSKDARAPFFEECKTRHAKDDGSVRRFRMDIPEEDDDEQRQQRQHRGVAVFRNGLVSVLTRRKSENETAGYEKAAVKSWRGLNHRRNSSFV
ncbi:hypothetical protein FQN49_006535 [Arthroderma sp. PD_2]|nr:hypothetical protein FQN49_006535 [Arthroderma sp. PD_2]